MVPHMLPGVVARCGSRSLSILRGTGLQPQSRHRRNRRQRLAAEPQGRDRQQIVGTADLRRRVPLERQQGIVAHHAAAVIGDLDQLLAAAFHLHPNAPRPRVQRVFQQFLHHRSRALHHLAGGDLVGDVFRENVNAAHGASVRSIAVYGLSLGVRFSVRASVEKHDEFTASRSCPSLSIRASEGSFQRHDRKRLSLTPRDRTEDPGFPIGNRQSKMQRLTLTRPLPVVRSSIPRNGEVAFEKRGCSCSCFF